MENNNAAGKEILDDDRIVGDSVNFLVTPKNEENESEGDTSVCKASGSSNDEELTSLTWLQNTNLLQSNCILFIRKLHFYYHKFIL